MYINPRPDQSPHVPHIPISTIQSVIPPLEAQQPYLGEAIYPGDETSSTASTEGLLSAPATSGAEQDMQAASLEHHLGVSATSGAQEVPEAADNPDGSKAEAPVEADTPPAPTAGGGGAKPPGPPEAPIPAAEGGEPDDGLRPTPRLDTLAAHDPSENEAAVAAAIQAAAIRRATTEFSAFTHSSPQADSTLRLRANTQDGYVDLLIHDGAVTVNTEVFSADTAAITRNLEESLEPNQSYTYAMPNGAEDVTRTPVPADEARHHVSLFPDLLSGTPPDEQDASLRLGTSEAVVIAELIARAEPTPVSLTEIKQVVEQREYELYETVASNQEAAAAATVLASVVAQAARAFTTTTFDSPTPSANINPRQYIGYEEGLTSDAHAQTHISLGWEASEPPSLQSLGELGPAFYIPDTLDALDQPALSPRVEIAATAPMPQDDQPYWRSRLSEMGYDTGAATIQEGIQYTARVDEGKLMIEMTTSILLDGQPVFEDQQINAEGTVGDAVRLQHYLRKPHYISNQVQRAWEYNH